MSENKRENNSQKNIMPARRGGGPGSRFARVIEKPKDTKGTLKRLIGYLSSSKVLIITLLIIVIFYTVSNVLSNLFIKDVVASLGKFNPDIQMFTVAPDEDKFLTSLIVLCCLYIAYIILQYLSNLISAHISCRMVRNLRKDLFNKIVKLPINYVDTHAHGDIMSRMTNDCRNVSNAVTSSLTSLISGILTIIGCLGVMLWYSPLLTLIALSTLVLTLIFTKIMSKYLRPLFVKQQAILGELNSATEEMVTGSKTVMAYNHQSLAMKEFNQKSDVLTHLGTKAQVFAGSMGPVMNFIGNVGYFLVCLFGALFIIKGIGNTLIGEPLTIAIVIMFLSTTKQFTRPINEIAQLYSTFITALAGAERVFELMDEKTESFDGEIEFDSEKINGTIDFDHVEFSYVEDKPVLKDFNVDFYGGHKIALVGATGSGKTTIVNLILRFYDVNSGSIKIDGIDIAKVSKKDLRSAISIVLQDPVLFGETIENNIRYAREDASDEEVDEALRFANCDSFVEALPEKKKTMLTEGAENISQGQRQLLTIARAVLANPKILILDEATSSVDTRTEKKIQDAMVKLMNNRTSIIIAHRLSTIQDADLIVVLDQGIVVEMGNHQELVEKNGVYNRLYQTQFKGIKI